MIVLRILHVPDHFPDGVSATFADKILSPTSESSLLPFPGRPVHLFVVRFFLFLGIDGMTPFVLPGILSCAFALLPLFHIVKRIAGIREAWIAALLYALHPGLFSYTIYPLSDAVLLFPTLLGVRLTLRMATISKEEAESSKFISHYAGSALFAFSVGISTNAIQFLFPPLILAIISSLRHKKKAALVETINGYLIGFATWMIPLLLKVNLINYLFTAFDLHSDAYPAHIQIIQSVKLLVWNIAIYGHSLSAPKLLAIILPIPALLLAAKGFVRILSSKSRYHFFLFATVAVFAAVSADNPANPDSFAALFPYIIILTASALDMANKKFLIFSFLVVLISLTTMVDRINIIKSGETAINQLNRYLSQLSNSNDLTVICGSSKKAIEQSLPEIRIFEAKSIDELHSPRFTRIKERYSPYYISDIPGLESPGNRQIDTIMTFAPLFLYEGHNPCLILYK